MANKLEYIARMFSRAQSKVYENYVVTSIYHRINNFDLKPVTQQKVVSNDDPEKYYLLDLYFPQINYGIEIDEPAHNNPAYQLHDITRADDVYQAIKCKEEVVKIDSNCDLDDVNKQIDKIVDEVKKIISDTEKKTGSKLEWPDNATMLKKAYNRKSIDVSEDIDYGNFTQIWQGLTGETLKGNRVGYKPLRDGNHLWVPWLSADFRGKTYKSGNGKWENILNEDKTEIIEKGNKQLDPVGQTRVVFMHMKDEFGKPGVRFIGVFKLVEYVDFDTARYERIATTYSW